MSTRLSLHFIKCLFAVVGWNHARSELFDLLFRCNPDLFGHHVFPCPVIQEHRHAGGNVLEAFCRRQTVSTDEDANEVDILGRDTVVFGHQLFTNIRRRLDAECQRDVDKLLLEVK